MKSFRGTVLVVDDDPDIREVLKDRLGSLGCRVMEADNGREALDIIERQNPHIMLLDIEMPDMNGLQVLEEVRKRGHDMTVVMITAYGTVERAVEAMKQGAYDFISKPFDPDHVALTVQKALEREGLKRGVKVLSEQFCERYRMVPGTSTKMQRAFEMARKAAQGSSTVLLLGESGTGKEVFARGIHSWGDRRDKPFIAVNCVGLSRELLESELFGHEKGAFTGANQLKKGKMEMAHGGIVFLDEIGDITPEIQKKLLRFLQEREFERVGGTRPIHVDVKIIAATNRDLEQEVKEERFRTDLFYRLNVVPIALPALRERREDIPALGRYFVTRFAQETNRESREITKEALEKLVAYQWPGNVRELANVMERAIVLGKGPQIDLTDLPPRIVSSAPAARSNDRPYREVIDDRKREVIQTALVQAQGNKAAAAKALGLQRSYLSRLIKQLRVQ